MVSPKPTSQNLDLAEAANIYTTVTSLAYRGDKSVAGISISDVNQRLLSDISTKLSRPLDVIKTEVRTSLEIVKDVANEASTVSSVTTRELSTMPAKLKVDTISTIPSRVKVLLANFQNGVEDPRSLYPRLICCDAPIDPAKAVNFAKKYRLLDQTLQVESEKDVGDRSMPNSPKSAVDVITNVNSSLESVSDSLFEAVDSVTAISESFEAIRVDTRNLASLHETIDDLLNTHEEMLGSFDQVTSMFAASDERRSLETEDSEDVQGIMQIIQNASSLLAKFETRCFDEDIVPRLQNANGVVSEIVKNISAVLLRAKSAVSRFAEVMKKFASNLPRIAQELRQFFVPTGVRALIMKPSPDLMSLLQSIETLRTVLPDAEVLEKSVLDALGESEVNDKLRAIQRKLGDLVGAPQKLLNTIANQELVAVISRATKESLENILRELRDSVTDVMELVGDHLSIDDMGSKIGNLLPFSSREDADKPLAGDQNLAGLVENVTDAGGLFGRLFGT